MKKLLICLLIACGLYSADAITSVTGVITITNTPTGYLGECIQFQSSFYTCSTLIAQ